MADSRDEPRVGCFKGCAFGCLAVAILGVLGGVLASRAVVAPFRAAIAGRAELEQRFGGQGDFTPAGDGLIPPQRVEAFLAVRAALAPVGARLAALVAEIRALEQSGEAERPSKVETMSQAFATTQAAFRVAPLLGEYLATRNRALLAAGMGLGEYSYLYVAAYGARFATTPSTQVLATAPLNPRVRELVVAMLRRQRQATGDGPGELAAALDVELAALAADPQRTPWPDGPPGPVARSLEPHRAALAQAFNPDTVGIELLENRERRFGIESE